MEYEKQKLDRGLYPSAPTDEAYPPPPYSTQYPPASGTPYSQPPSSAPYYQGGQMGYHGQQPSPAGYTTGQPQMVVVVPDTQPEMVVVQANTVSMIGAIVLSCFVTWCFFCLFGLVAFILALVGQNHSSKGNAAGAIQLRNASYGVSIAGIVLGIVCIVLFVTL